MVSYGFQLSSGFKKYRTKAGPDVIEALLIERGQKEKAKDLERRRVLMIVDDCGDDCCFILLLCDDDLW